VSHFAAAGISKDGKMIILALFGFVQSGFFERIFAESGQRYLKLKNLYSSAHKEICIFLCPLNLYKNGKIPHLKCNVFALLAQFGIMKDKKFKHGAWS
jgi:hypothetical protein